MTIKNEQEYDMALREVDRLMELNPALGSKESYNLEVLLLLIEKYEEENWDISEPDPSA
jgi:HTH-type transcriptional regulator/antitoxin HigA